MLSSGVKNDKKAKGTKAKVLLTDYVWDSLEVERKILGDLADLKAMQTKKPEEFLG